MASRAKKVLDVAKNKQARGAAAKWAKGASKTKLGKARTKVAESRPVMGTRTNPKVNKAARKARGGAEQAEFATKRAAGKGKQSLKNANTRSKGSGPIKGAGPSKVRMKQGKKWNAAKVTYGSGRKRTTVASVTKPNGKGGMSGKTIAITPKKRAVAYSGTSVAGGGGYVTYKRKTKSGKVVTVRRKK